MEEALVKQSGTREVDHYLHLQRFDVEISA